MDKIIIKELEIFAYHGVFADEKTNGQKFYLTLELSLDLRPAGVSDDLIKTVHYGELCHDIVREFTAVSHDLIEKAAEEICRFILTSRPQISEVKLALSKPSAPIGLPLVTVAVQMTRSWHVAYIALGSNIGDRQNYLDSAVDKLGACCEIMAKSDYIVTKPFGCVGQEDYLNGVIAVRTLLTADELLERLMQIELSLGRVRLEHWGARTIDLDLLMFDQEIRMTEHLALPHPRMNEREFVLQPLCQIAPYLIHPLTGERVVDILDKVRRKG